MYLPPPPPPPKGYSSWKDYDNRKNKDTMNKDVFDAIQAATPGQRSFVATYINQFSNLAECQKVLSGEFGASAKFKEECTIRLRNIDLWIDAHHLQYPLTGFRLQVRKAMADLGVEPWPDYVYKTSNHFKEKE